MPVQRSNGRDDQAGLAGSPLARLTEDPFSDIARRRPPCGTAPRAQLERNRSGRPSTDLREQVVDPHNVFTRDLDLPRGHERERVFVRGHSYELRGSESHALGPPRRRHRPSRSTYRTRDHRRSEHL